MLFRHVYALSGNGGTASHGLQGETQSLYSQSCCKCAAVTEGVLSSSNGKSLNMFGCGSTTQTAAVCFVACQRCQVFGVMEWFLHREDSWISDYLGFQNRLTQFLIITLGVIETESGSSQNVRVKMANVYVNM